MGELSGAPVFDDYLVAHSILTDARAELNFSSLAVPDGATGLGRALTEMGMLAGIPIIIGVDDAAGEEEARAMGATHIARRDKGAMAEQVIRLTDGKGADLVVDQVAGPDFAGMFEMVADFGNVLVTGWTAGDAPRLFETMWAALDRCPCMQIWTRDRYRSVPDRLNQLEREVATFLETRSRPLSDVGA